MRDHHGEGPAVCFYVHKNDDSSIENDDLPLKTLILPLKMLILPLKMLILPLKMLMFSARDVGTRLFLKKCVETLDIPVLALMDADPYGLSVKMTNFVSKTRNCVLKTGNRASKTRYLKW